VGWFSDTFELQRGGGAGNVRPMEGLRGFAVFLVFFVHYCALVKPWIAGSPALLALARGLHDIGGTGVGPVLRPERLSHLRLAHRPRATLSSSSCRGGSSASTPPSRPSSPFTLC
jgi:hypothetical protein